MKKILYFILIFSSLSFIIYSCNKDENENISGSSEATFKTTIAGIVLNESNQPVNSVIVTAYGQTTNTNQYGIFVFKDISVNKKRCVVQFSKAGFFNRSQAFIPTENSVNYTRVILLSNAQTHTISSATGGTVTLTDNSSVQFVPNSFVTTSGSMYNGTVGLAVKHLSPDDANFGFMIPGGDLLGKDAGNSDVALYTYGMLSVELKGSSSESLQLATGTTATLTMSIAASQLAAAPASIPFWYFDETTSLWKEEGTATKVGNNYVGTVKHFSSWNCDLPRPIIYVKGKVLDCNHNPLQNIRVTANGWHALFTNQNGEYFGVVSNSATISVQVLSANNGGIISDSQIENVSPTIITGYQTLNIPDLIVSCPTTISGKLNSCGGSKTDGIVYCNFSGFTSYQATVNSDFSLPVKPNSTISIDATDFINSFHLDTLSGAPGIEMALNNILLCTAIDFSENSFTLSRLGMPDSVIHMYPVAFAESYERGGSLHNHLSWITSGTHIDSLHFQLGTTSGIYHWGSQHGHGGNGTKITFYLYSDNGNEIILLGNGSPDIYGEININIGQTGERVQGTISGTINYAINGNFFSIASVNGSFNLPRTR